MSEASSMYVDFTGGGDNQMLMFARACEEMLAAIDMSSVFAFLHHDDVPEYLRDSLSVIVREYDAAASQLGGYLLVLAAEGQVRVSLDDAVGLKRLRAQIEGLVGTAGGVLVNINERLEDA